MITIKVSDGNISRFLANEARRFDCRPDQVGLALISCTANADMTDAVLDGTDPSAFGIAVPSLQTRVLRAFAGFQAPNGSYLVSLTDLAQVLGYPNRGAIRNAIERMIAKKLLIKVENSRPGRAGIPTRYRLTQAGEDFMQRISSDADDNG